MQRVVQKTTGKNAARDRPVAQPAPHPTFTPDPQARLNYLMTLMPALVPLYLPSETVALPAADSA